MVPWVLKPKSANGSSDDEPRTFHRYYHLYEATELERDIERAGGRVLDSGYEKDNWWAIATRSEEWRTVVLDRYNLGLREPASRSLYLA